MTVNLHHQLSAAWDIILSAAHYPFITLSGIEISLAALLKLVVLLALALLLLGRARRKAEAVLARQTRLSPGSAASISTLGYYVAAALVLLSILNTVGINLTQLTVLFGALGIGIAFGLQNILNNFISGLIMLAERVIKTGDIVNLKDDLTGEVQRISIRYTVIRTVNGDDVIVPNSEFVSGRVNSWTYADDWRRLAVPFTVAQAADPEEVVRLATEAARAVEITREDAAHPILVFCEGFSESGLKFSLRVWCRLHQLGPDSGLHSDYYFALHKKLKELRVP